MKIFHHLMPLVCWCGLWVQAQPAQAAISCNVSSPGFTSVYDTTVATANDNVSSATINCTRASGDATSVSYSLPADNGLNPKGKNNNQARLGSSNSLILYEVFRDAARSSRWGPDAPFTGTINFGTGTSATLTLPYYVRIPALQNVPAGIYTDSVTMTLTYGKVTAPGVTFPVQINVNTSCKISTPPDNVVFTYTSFQVTPASANTGFATTCTDQLPYTMALDATSGTLLGLNYSLSLSASSGVGTGLAQSYTINGSIVAGQAGACAGASCSATAPRTLTITY